MEDRHTTDELELSQDRAEVSVAGSLARHAPVPRHGASPDEGGDENQELVPVPSIAHLFDDPEAEDEDDVEEEWSDQTSDPRVKSGVDEALESYSDLWLARSMTATATTSTPLEIGTRSGARSASSP